jgi:hypothetical protein
MVDPRTPLNNSCEHAQTLLVDMLPESFAEGSMPSAEDLAFLERHLLDCRACQVYQEDMAMLTASMTELDDVPVPDGLADKIMQRVAMDVSISAPSLGEPEPALTVPPVPVMERAAEPSRTSKVVPLRWAKAVPIAAAVLLLALAVPSIMKTTGQHASAPEVAVKPVVNQPAPAVPEVQSPAAAVTETEHVAAVPAMTTTLKAVESTAQPASVAAQPASVAAQPASVMARPAAMAQPESAQLASLPATKASVRSSRAASSLADVDASELVASVPDMGGDYEDPVSNLVGY